jgi:hypothetical protein
MRAFRSAPTGWGLALSKSKLGVLESFPIKNPRAESTMLSLCADGLKSKRQIAAAVTLANFVKAEIDGKG